MGTTPDEQDVSQTAGVIAKVAHSQAPLSARLVGGVYDSSGVRILFAASEVRIPANVVQARLRDGVVHSSVICRRHDANEIHSGLLQNPLFPAGWSSVSTLPHRGNRHLNTPQSSTQSYVLVAFLK
ncbi:unnamed protein product [Protopolystoma xenopodis]|uniref:Uncharacterized protein n=1 Tax=Protopolystoma xenopodis TaxID=117903 RepID=A0A448WBN3_9PLAT|nr:unnamed protein product [Protopolystoma xenopodis]